MPLNTPTIIPTPVLVQDSQQDQIQGDPFFRPETNTVVIGQPVPVSTPPQSTAPGAGQTKSQVLIGQSGSQRGFRYPNDLGETGSEPFIIFDIHDNVLKDSKSKGVIAMYMPPTIKTAYKALYSEIRNLAKFYSTQGRAAWNDIANMEVGKLGETVGFNVANVFSDSVATSQAELNLRKLLNPQMTQAFNGMSFRNFQFDFQMMARSPEESEAINNIIYNFKLHMHPGLEGTVDDSSRFITYPETFLITLFTPETKYIFRTGRCVLTDMDVDYAGSGVPSFFDKTGAPVDIRMTLQFTEMAQLHKEDIKQGL